jgi:Flp pilus assembly protein TadD
LAHLFRREHDDAGLQLETGMEINPNDSRVRAIYGFYLSAVGQHDEALRQLDIVAAHDPREEMWIPWVRGIAFFTAQRYEAAIRSLKQVANPNTEVRGWLAASLAMNGRTVEAKAMLDDLLRLAESDMAVFPGRRLRDWEEYWHGAIESRDQKDFDHLFAALRKAGMAE